MYNIWVQGAFGGIEIRIVVVLVVCTSIETKPPQLHATGTHLAIACVYVPTPVQLATTRTKNPAKHANLVYQVLTTMKLGKRRADLVQKDGVLPVQDLLHVLTF